MVISIGTILTVWNTRIHRINRVCVLTSSSEPIEPLAKTKVSRNGYYIFFTAGGAFKGQWKSESPWGWATLLGNPDACSMLSHTGNYIWICKVCTLWKICNICKVCIFIYQMQNMQNIQNMSIIQSNGPSSLKCIFCSLVFSALLKSLTSWGARFCIFQDPDLFRSPRRLNRSGSWKVQKIQKMNKCKRC